MIAEIWIAFFIGLGMGVAAGSSRSSSSTSSVRGLLDDRREEIRSAYEEGRISHDRFAREIELLEDPSTEAVMHQVADVDGVGPATALEIAREYRRPEALEDATADDLTSVNGVGENRARAIDRRLGGRSA